MELLRATEDIFRSVQTEKYGPGGSKPGRCFQELRKLKPFERDGILYLGGRVPLPANRKPLVIVPASGRVTELLVMHHHLSCGHAGASHVLSSVRRKHWIIHGMATVRRILKGCSNCRLLNAPPCQQVMAPLPNFRTEVDFYPFIHTGLDYFGPIYVKVNRTRVKRYGCLFTCMQTRAVHIEIVHNMTTDSFLMALLRFIGRRGRPKFIYSDNGSNFVGAEAELKSLCRSLNQGRIHDAMLVHEIEWCFNPPSASHRGGVWERMIRSVRKVLSHLIRDQLVTDEVLLTCMAEAERIVNDRPLIPVYDDPDQPTVLRPSDMLILRHNTGLVSDVIPLRERLTKYWRQSQHLANTFWKRWKTEYVPLLQTTQKWLMPKRNLVKGDLVLLCKDDAPRGCWPKGIVIETYPGVDGLVRQVLVKTKGGPSRRDVRSLCLLEGAED